MSDTSETATTEPAPTPPTAAVSPIQEQIQKLVAQEYNDVADSLIELGNELAKAHAANNERITNACLKLRSTAAAIRAEGDVMLKQLNDLSVFSQSVVAQADETARQIVATRGIISASQPGASPPS